MVLKRNEKGRSMIEMLGVLGVLGILGIMAVITVLSISAYSMAMRNVQLGKLRNEVYQVQMILYNRFRDNYYDMMDKKYGEWKGVNDNDEKSRFYKLLVEPGHFKTNETPFGGNYYLTGGADFLAIAIYGLEQKDINYLNSQTWSEYPNLLENGKARIISPGEYKEAFIIPFAF